MTEQVKNSEKIPQKKARRTFFAGLGAVAAAGVVAKVAPESVSHLTHALTPQGPDDKNYRLSEHIKKYYRTTTI
jgi:hypothetical protein